MVVEHRLCRSVHYGLYSQLHLFTLIESSCKDGPYPSLSWILSYAPTHWIPANYHIVVARRWQMSMSIHPVLISRDIT